MAVQKSTHKTDKTPERYAVRIYSEILGCHLCIAQEDEADRKTLRGRGISEAIYSGDEVRALKGKGKDYLRAVHAVKEMFPDSLIEDLKEDVRK